MMGAPSTSEYQQQGFIPYDPIRNFLQFNIMQQPQFYSQQEDRKDFNLGRFYLPHLFEKYLNEHTSNVS
jgi:MADS-box transcription factor